MNDIAENTEAAGKSFKPRVLAFRAGQVWQFHPELRVTVEKVIPASSLILLRVERSGTNLGVLEQSYGMMTSDVLRYSAALVRAE